MAGLWTVLIPEDVKVGKLRVLRGWLSESRGEKLSLQNYQKITNVIKFRPF